MTEKTKWISIKVPEPLYNKIKEIAETSGRHLYQVIEEAMTFYINNWRRVRHKDGIPRLDKCAWYVFKLAQSVGAFKENPSLENYQKLLKTIFQIKERIGVDTSLLEHVVDKLNPRNRKEISVDEKIELNDVTKLVISDIIVKLLFEEEVATREPEEST